MSGEKLLMTPGPTMVPPEVLEVMGRQLVHHRTKEFRSAFKQLNENLKYIFQTQNHILVFSASGTGAMESVIANLFSEGDKVLVASTGVFGERFAKIAEAFGLQVDRIPVEWGKAVDPGEIEQKLKEDSRNEIRAVIVTHNETSTGVTNDIESIGKIVSQTDRLFIIDAISSIGGLDIQTDNWGIDVVVGASQKALMTPPGLAFASMSEKAWEAHKGSRLPKFYWNYSSYRKGLEQDLPDTPFTPSIALMLAQNQAINLIRDEGLSNVFNRHKRLALATQAGTEALGLELFADRHVSSYIITAVKAPQGVDIEKVRKLMNEKFDIMVAGGQQHLKGSIIRIGHCGYVKECDLTRTFTAFEHALKESGYSLKVGTGVEAVKECLRKEQEDK